MKAIIFNRAEHLSILSRFAEKRQFYCNTNELPANGVVIFKEETPIALAFIRIAEGGIGIFDGLMTDPDIASIERSEALDLAIDAITGIAAQKQLKGLIAWTIDKSTLMRATEHGYCALEPHHFMCLVLPHSERV